MRMKRAEDRDEGEDASAGVVEEVGAEHAADGPARADQRHLGFRGDRGEGERGGDAAK